MDSTSSNGTSHLAWLRARHDELKKDRTLDLAVPGYQGRLVVRFGPVPWAIMARIQPLLTREDREARGQVAAMCDAMIAACREVLFDGEPIDPSGETRRFDPELAALFGIETTSARSTVEWLYPNEFAINGVAGELLEWTQRADAETAEEFVGE